MAPDLRPDSKTVAPLLQTPLREAFLRKMRNQPTTRGAVIALIVLIVLALGVLVAAARLRQWHHDCPAGVPPAGAPHQEPPP